MAVWLRYIGICLKCHISRLGLDYVIHTVVRLSDYLDKVINCDHLRHQWQKSQL